MGATKNLFELMREQEIQTTNFLPTKKEVEFSAKKLANKIIEDGEINPYEAFSNFVRLSNYAEIVKDEIKSHLPKEKHISFGVEVTPVNGRALIQFQEDELWQQLKHKLSQREELIKLALKTDEPIYDSDGVQVPKVSVKYASDSLNIKY